MFFSVEWYSYIASIRPRPFSRGNENNRISIPLYNTRASIRPRPFSRGNHPTTPSKNRSNAASIRPRPFSRGNGDLKNCTFPIFNQLQFGHGLSAVETIRWNSFSLRWSTRFNSATTFQPWKPIGNIVRLVDFIAASIRPRPFSRGNGDNGSNLGTSVIWLQFAHDLSAVETWR